jgi:hypothetical protein
VGLAAKASREDRFSMPAELKGRQDVDPFTASKRGRVVDVLVDPTNCLAGLTIAADGDQSHDNISAMRIARLGAAAVMLRRDEGDVDDTDLRYEDYLDYASLVGLRSWTKEATVLGACRMQRPTTSKPAFRAAQIFAKCDAGSDPYRDPDCDRDRGCWHHTGSVTANLRPYTLGTNAGPGHAPGRTRTKGKHHG